MSDKEAYKIHEKATRPPSLDFSINRLYSKLYRQTETLSMGFEGAPLWPYCG